MFFSRPRTNCIISRPTADSVLARVCVAQSERSGRWFFGIFTTYISVMVLLVVGIGVVLGGGLSMALALLHHVYSRSDIVEESLLAVRHLGIQISKKSRAGKETEERFVSRKSIKEVYVIEGFTASRVIVYFGIELKKEGEDLVVPFEYLDVPAKVSGEILREVRDVLGLHRGDSEAIR